MIRLLEQGAYVFPDGRVLTAAQAESPDSMHRDAEGRVLTEASRREAAQRTMAYQILNTHDQAPEETASSPDARHAENTRTLRLRFDCLASHDITYVGIIQTLRASDPGLAMFPVPYVLSNCHNSLCAVGGTINSDDHTFGLSAAKKYGGVYVPPHMAVIHQYMREMMTACGGMILGSDSHTRYGALGTMGFGEGGGELVKQLLSRTYDIPMPEVVGVMLTGEPGPGVGPQDVALSLIGAVFENGYAKNKILEFFGDGVSRLSMDYRNGIDVMTTETACLSSIWITDGQTESFYAAHGRADAYRTLAPGACAYYDGLIEIDLSAIKPMIALPFHPSRVFAIETLNRNPDILAGDGAATDGFSLADRLDNGRLRFGQAVIAGCAGGLYENICAAADILDGHDTGNGSFTLNVYPASQPVMLALTENGAAARLMRAGAVIKTAFCGPCFGAGDVPAHNTLSARHATRNFPNREGSKPNAGQSAAVALMDARSIAATAKNGGLLTAASEADHKAPQYYFDGSLYAKRVYDGRGRHGTGSLITGPGIRDWPELAPLAEDLLLRVAAFITDAVTTTDELIPSGETSSYRSNPMALAEFTLSRKCPGYVSAAKAAAEPEARRRNNQNPLEGDTALAAVFAKLEQFSADAARTGFGSVVYAVKPGDGSAREQAASCQRVLGGWANMAREYATKRYRSNLVNWGMLPFVLPDAPVFGADDYIYIPGIYKAVTSGAAEITAYVVKAEGDMVPFTLTLPGLSDGEAEIILRGGLINHYRHRQP